MAGNRSLGSLTLDMVVKFGAWAAGLDQAERKMKRSTDKMSSMAKGLGTALGLSFAGVAAGITASISGAIDRMDQLRDASIRLGVGTETLSAFGYAAQQTGTDIDSLGKAFKILTKNIAGASEGRGKAPIFEALGISVKDAQGNLKQLEQIVPEIADAFAQLEDGTQKAALAQELFGKSGLDLTEFLNSGSAGLKEFTGRARELGLVVDQEAADKADKFNDSIADLKAQIVGLSSDVAIELLPVLSKMVDEFRDWVGDGDNAAKIAREIASGITTIADAVRALGSVLGFLDGLKQKLGEIQQSMVDNNIFTIARKKFQEQVWGRSGDWDFGGFVDKPGAKQTSNFNPGMFRIPGIDQQRQQFSAVPLAYSPKAANPFPKLTGALGGYKPPKEPKAGHGKSESEKEAERLKKAINEMTDAQRAWQTELDGTGNKVADDYARRLDQITEKAQDFTDKGIPADKVAKFREEMTKLADELKAKETAEFLKEFSYETQEMIASANGASTASIKYAQAIDALDKALKSGIITQEEYAKRADALKDVRDAGALQVLRDIKEQGELLGKTAEEQDTLNKLRFAGVTANSEYGQSIIAANKSLHENAQATADQIAVMDEFRSGLADAFGDFITGAKSAKEAFTDFADNFVAQVLRMIAQKWIERAFGQQGTTGGGSGWGAILQAGASALFGGGRAAGGPVMPGMLYRVNENKPEVVSFDGRDYLMTGGKQGVVKPDKPAVVRQGDTNVYHFNFRGDDVQRSAAQAAAVRDYLQRIVRLRNGTR